MAFGGHQEPLELLGGQLGLQRGSWVGFWVQEVQLVLQGQREQPGQRRRCPLPAFWGLWGQLELREQPGQQQGSWEPLWLRQRQPVELSLLVQPEQEETAGQRPGSLEAIWPQEGWLELPVPGWQVGGWQGLRPQQAQELPGGIRDSLELLWLEQPRLLWHWELLEWHRDLLERHRELLVSVGLGDKGQLPQRVWLGQEVPQVLLEGLGCREVSWLQREGLGGQQLGLPGDWFW